MSDINFEYTIYHEIEFENRLIEFIKESNMIENIYREPFKKEIGEAKRFLGLKVVTIDDLVQFTKTYQKNAKLRVKSGQNVIIRNFRPLEGGMIIQTKLQKILDEYNSFKGDTSAFECASFNMHIKYEKLHPFTDCNGRSGRMLYLWFFYKHYGFLPKLSFLHTFYYLSLSNNKRGIDD